MLAHSSARLAVCIAVLYYRHKQRVGKSLPSPSLASGNYMHVTRTLQLNTGRYCKPVKLIHGVGRKSLSNS